MENNQPAPAPQHWYAVYTRPKWEKKVAGLLQEQGIAHYCPLNKVVRQWHDRRKLVEEPLFTSYVFVHLKEEEKLRVLQTKGVVSFVHWLRQPARIREEEIEAIRAFVGEHTGVRIEKSAVVRTGDAVQVLVGALAGREGTVVQEGTNSVKVLLPSLGVALVAHLNKEHVQVTQTAVALTRR